MSHLLLVPAPVGYGTPVSKFHHHVQHSLKQERRFMGAALSALSLTLHPPPITNSEAGESSVCRRIGRQQNWLWQATCAVLTQVIGKPHRSRTRTLSALGQVS